MSCESDVNSQITGDRFIPRRRLDFGDGQDKSQIQFEHEQGVLRFQTQCRNKRMKKRLPSWALFEEDQTSFQEDTSTQLRRAQANSPSDNTNSTKDSPSDS